MNERIKKLAEQAGYESDMFGIGRWEKFAELIIRECMDVVETAVDQREPASSYVDKIKAHFGEDNEQV